MDESPELELRTTLLESGSAREAKLDYDRITDTFFLEFDAPRSPRSTYYLENGVHAIYNPITREIVGFQVEYWKEAFLRQYPQLRRPWLAYWLIGRLTRALGGSDQWSQSTAPIVALVLQYAPLSSSS